MLFLNIFAEIYKGILANEEIGNSRNTLSVRCMAVDFTFLNLILFALIVLVIGICASTLFVPRYLSRSESIEPNDPIILDNNAISVSREFA